MRNSTFTRVATRQIKNLKRSWKHIWQRTCANTTPTSVAKTKQRTKRVYSSMHDGCNKRTCQLVVRHVEAAKSQSDCRLTIARPELAMRRWRCGNKGRLGVFLLAISEVGYTFFFFKYHLESGFYQRDEDPHGFSGTQVPMSPRKIYLSGGVISTARAFPKVRANTERPA